VTFVVLVTLGVVVFSLGQALFAMASGPDHSGKMVRALTWRIGLSVLVFAGLMIGWALGWIQPR
jgi:hypothetical protein